MGITYREKEHRPIIETTFGADGTITRGALIAGYLNWQFGGISRPPRRKRPRAKKDPAVSAALDEQLGLKS